MSKNTHSSLGELSADLIPIERNNELIYQPYNTKVDVCFQKTAGLWIASISLQFGDRRKYLGMYFTKEEAERAVLRASRMYNKPVKLG
jgi:hypothetical protein